MQLKPVMHKRAESIVMGSFAQAKLGKSNSISVTLQL